MAATEPTGNHSLHLGRALAIVGIALALAVGAFGVGAAASLAALSTSSRPSTAQAAPSVPNHVEVLGR